MSNSMTHLEWTYGFTFQVECTSEAAYTSHENHFPWDPHPAMISETGTIWKEPFGMAHVLRLRMGGAVPV